MIEVENKGMIPIFRIKTKSDPGKGASWVVSETPLIIGREKGCDIRIADPLVSRRHCQIMLDEGEVHLQDLGSRNFTLVNGKQVEKCLLHPGDEINIGQATLVLTQTSPRDSNVPDITDNPSTVTLAEGDVIYLSNSALKDFEKSGVTVTDVLQLFRASRIFSHATSLEKLIETLDHIIVDRLHPQCFWMALVEASDELFEYRIARTETSSSASGPPEESMRKSLEELRGFLVPEQLTSRSRHGALALLIVPIFFGTHPIGVIALQVDAPHKPYDEKDLHFLIALAHAVAPFFGAIEKLNGLEKEVEWLRAKQKQSLALIGGSPAMRRLREQAAKVAQSPAPVLIIGETGTGKELVARLIHDLSNRVQGPLITVNCAAIPTDLIESELFGYEKGAFTGAHERHIGLIEQSGGGTLFLDEIGDLSTASQARILRALETKQIRRIGGKEEISVDFRVISATNKDISDGLKYPSFRRDLYHRLRAVEIRIPPLRERKTDIPELAEHFLRSARYLSKHPLRGFADGAMDFLDARSWTGNVRELKNSIETAVTFSANEFITAEDLQLAVNEQEAQERPISLEEVQQRHIIKTLDYCRGHVLEAAKILGIGKSKLYDLIAEYRARGILHPE